MHTNTRLIVLKQVYNNTDNILHKITGTDAITYYKE